MACHLIDGEGEFVSQEVFQKALIKPEIVGKPYWVVGIFGGQSTGKSTLLNGLFGTQFQVMNEEGGRTQTTRGIWLAGSQHTPNLFAMDVEGTDGQERFDNQTFERRSSLFALATCDVLVINMWTSEVGRFNGANLSLLRSIFELNLQLFPKSSRRTMLLFVLRDHTAGTLEKHVDVIQSSLNKVWEGVYRADSSLAIKDVFDTRFFSFPHYGLQRSEFDEKMVTLRTWFDPSEKSFILQTSAARDDVPLDGFHPYMANCWSTICLNKDIDIPTQKELLAKHRCAEIAEAAMADVKKQIDDWKNQIVKERKSVKGLGDAITQLAFKKQTEMQEEAVLYAKRIVEAASTHLKDAILKACEEVLSLQVDLAINGYVENYESAVHSAVDRALQIGGGPAKAWPLIREGVKAQQEEVRTLLQSKVADGTLDNLTHDKAEATLHKALDDAVQHRLKVISQDTHKYMTTAFEYALHHHADGTNRFFNSTGVLTTTAASVKNVGFEYLNSIFVNRLKDATLDSTVALTKSGPQSVALSMPIPDGVPVVINVTESQRAYEMYLQQADFTVQLIQKGIEMSSNRIPVWFWGLFLFFALDDMWFIITNPWLVLLAIFVGYFFFKDFIVKTAISFLTDPPVWFTYIEMFLDQNLPGFAAVVREKRAAITNKVAPTTNVEDLDADKLKDNKDEKKEKEPTTSNKSSTEVNRKKKE